MSFVWPDKDLKPWLEALHHEKVVAAPAEGVYGYCCDPFSEKALKELSALKQRPKEKLGYIILCKSWHQAETYYGVQSPKKLAMNAEESPTTYILNGHAIRVPACDYMQAYLNAWGKPLISTSLNLSGQPPALSADEVPPQAVSLTLPQRLSGQPSRIYNVTDGCFIR